MADCGKSKNKGWLKAFKIGCLSIIVLFLIIVFVVVGWFFYVTYDVEVHDEDLICVFTNVPVAKNGYFAIESIFQRIADDEIDLSDFSLTNGVPSERSMAELPAFLAQHSDILEKFYSVAEYPRYQYPIDEDVSIFEQETGPVAGLCSLENLSLYNIEYLIRQGREEEALNCLTSHLRVGQMVQNDAKSLIDGIIGFGMHNQALGRLVEYLSEGVFPENRRPSLSALLVAVRDGSDWQRMAKAEYSSSKEICASTVDTLRTNLPSITPARMVKVFYNESRTLKPMAQYYHEMLESFCDPDVQVSFPLIDPEKVSALDWFRLYASGNIAGHLVHLIIIPSIMNVNMSVLEQRSRAGLIELYLASWKYYDEQGELPDELNLLVPEYLSELPVDPFGKGAGFLYDPVRKEIYSAGVERSEKQDDLKISLGFAE